MSQLLTGKPSVDRPWLKYYPPEINQIQIPNCTLTEYLHSNIPSMDLTAIHYYGTDISWNTVFVQVDLVARSLKALGVKNHDQIPAFLRAVPEFIYLLLAAEKIGASLLCRDNTLEENVEAVRNASAEVLFIHDFMTQEELEAYLSGSKVKKVVLLDPCTSGDRSTMPDYIQRFLNSFYQGEQAHGNVILTWAEFLELGKQYDGTVAAKKNVNRPLFRCYTSGSTGPSKQVIHSANSMLGIIHQMNFYGSSDQFRPTWLATHLPPALIAVTLAWLILPLASNKLLILSPFCDVEDVDLEMMRYRPNCWPLIPMFIEVVMRNGRVPDDYDMSHLFSVGIGCEAFNNNQIKRAQKFVNDHNCKARFTTGYGCSEAGSNMTLPMSPHAVENGNVGVPMPLTTMSIFKPGTMEELTYNQIGEICKSGPGNMLGYDSREATNKALKIHPDGSVWLHTGDLGYMNEDGVVYVLNRGKSERFGGGELATLPMENLVADAEIEGLDDEFFVIIPDKAHPGYFVPYLYVVLEPGYHLDDIRDKVLNCLEPHMYPVDIIQLSERPFFHYKTNRIGLTQMLNERA